MRGDEAVERVEALARLAVELADDAVGDHERRLGIAGAVHRDEPERGLGRGSASRAAAARVGAHAEALAARLVAHASLRSRPRSASTTAASRTKAAQRGAAALGEVARRSSRARPRSRAAAAARCRRRAPRRPGSDASSAARSRFSASCSRPAARATAAWRSSVCGVARRSSGETRPARRRLERDLRERRAAGRRHELGPPLAERIVEERIHALRLAAGLGRATARRYRAAAIHACNDRHRLRGAHRPHHGRRERHRRGERRGASWRAAVASRSSTSIPRACAATADELGNGDDRHRRRRHAARPS